ncbi:deoxyribodipyrimidine photo-lyase [Caballeronia sp. LZ001]|uniref:cryptochrome/photolyase family protein n=1 Tax=Caballeronia sp. LZ001 TaxID=3038553 RepID=UPI002855B99D|nr:deoxyribodipyrimidine photo-lyase [Caballeronia sp. LZ001]MDR5804174.1 deoxyribodipyrimidine photo-lyase [Caballeronia sp. LZ001]
MADFDVGLVWIRRDLRAADNAALYHALTRCRRVLCAFVFDRDILSPLARNDRRVPFIHASVVELDRTLRDAGGTLMVRHGVPLHEISELAVECGANAVFANRDYEPSAKARDEAVAQKLASKDIAFFTFKDQSIFDHDDVLTGSSKPYTVFTPYKRKWLATLTPDALKPYASEDHLNVLAKPPGNVRHAIPSLDALGFGAEHAPAFPAGTSGAYELFDDFIDRMADYDHARDFPALKGPSYLGVHLRHGTVSIRALARTAHDAQRHGNKGAETWLSELIWRDFYFSVLHHFPHVGVPGDHRAFKPEYDRIQWETDDAADANFAAWCAGQTGYPLVDAAMRQINQSGYMHNRLRMVVASFLTKDLGLDWRRGEAYFEALLNDFELSSNNGGWQWASSSGCDAQPYFRIFNPTTQSKKFDAAGKFIRHYVPEIAGLSDRDIHAPWLAKPDALSKAGISLGADYPQPVVDHDAARKRTLARYDVVRGPAKRADDSRSSSADAADEPHAEASD